MYIFCSSSHVADILLCYVCSPSIRTQVFTNVNIIWTGNKVFFLYYSNQSWLHEQKINFCNYFFRAHKPQSVMPMALRLVTIWILILFSWNLLMLFFRWWLQTHDLMDACSIWPSYCQLTELLTLLTWQLLLLLMNENKRTRPPSMNHHVNVHLRREGRKRKVILRNVHMTYLRNWVKDSVSMNEMLENWKVFWVFGWILRWKRILLAPDMDEVIYVRNQKIV